MSSVSAVDARPMLRIAGLRKSFPGTRRAPSKPVLDGIDLEVGRGECVVLIGASGSGKSTLLRCCNLLENSQKGEILFLGEPVRWKGQGLARVPADRAQVTRFAHEDEHRERKQQPRRAHEHQRDAPAIEVVDDPADDQPEQRADRHPESIEGDRR